MMLLWHHLFYKKTFFKKHMILPLFLTQDQLYKSGLFCGQCLSVFAFITGYGFYLSLKKQTNGNTLFFGNWVTSRLKKIYCDYWFVFILVAVVTTLIDGRFVKVFFDENTTLFEGCFHAVINFFGLSYFYSTPTQCSTWWYMSEVIVFIISAPAFFLCSNCFGSIATVALASILPRILGIENVKVYGLIIPFLIGMWFSKDDLFTKLFNWKICSSLKVSSVLKLLMISILFLLSVYTYFQVERSVYWGFARGLLTIPMILFFVFYLIHVPGIRSILIFLGDYSLYIFLLHTFIKSTYCNGFVYGLRYPLLMFTVLLLASLGLSIIVCWAKNKLFFFVRYYRKESGNQVQEKR